MKILSLILNLAILCSIDVWANEPESTFNIFDKEIYDQTGELGNWEINGSKYYDLKLLSKSKATATFRHSKGVSKFYYNKLPDSLFRGLDFNEFAAASQLELEKDKRVIQRQKNREADRIKKVKKAEENRKNYNQQVNKSSTSDSLEYEKKLLMSGDPKGLKLRKARLAREAKAREEYLAAQKKAYDAKAKDRAISSAMMSDINTTRIEINSLTKRLNDVERGGREYYDTLSVIRTKQAEIKAKRKARSELNK